MASALIALASCNKTAQFTIEGTVAQADGMTLYLESLANNTPAVIDSAKLDAQGAFLFEKPTTTYPEFYRIRLADSYINLSIDSTETVTITSQASKFGEQYSVEGSDNCEKIQDITLRSTELKREILRLEKGVNNKEITVEEFQEELLPRIEIYKKHIQSYVFENPRSTAAYFAIFQRIHNLSVFDPYNKEDMKPIAAVATSYDLIYPEWHRTIQLKEMAIQAIQYRRMQETPPTPVEENLVSESAYIEIELPNIYGKKVKLSDHIGKVILLDFTAYQSEYSPAYNMELAKVYEKYNKRGFEIFQVSLDSYVNFWQVSAANLPWVCVRDPKGVESVVAATYNVRNLPTAYLLNKEGEIVIRLESLEQIDKEIAKLL